MSDENEMNQGSDDAAIAAAAGFWSEGDREAAAASEVPDSHPSNAAALANEYADQRASLEQDGSLEPGEADGIPAEKEQSKKAPITGKSIQSKTPAENTEQAESGLDPVLRSIANDAGWSDAKIDRLFKADPELAIDTFNQLADQYANLSRQYLNVAPVQQTAAAFQSQPAQLQQPVKGNASELPAALTDEGLKNFAQVNGQETADLVKAIRDHFVARDAAKEDRISKFEAQIKEADARVVATEANTTIDGLRKQFPKLYGASSDPSTLTMGQYQKTVELATLADQIRAGAKAQGRNLSVADAIKRAHYIVSRDSVKAEAREEIVSQITKRSARATAKPTQRNNPAAPGNTRSDEAAVAAAAEKMAEIGMND